MTSAHLPAFLSGWTCSNLVTAALLLLLLLAARRMSRSGYWRLAAREIVSRKAAVVSAVILSLYMTVALLDSVGWRSPLRSAETGEIVTDSRTGKPILDNGASALDHILKPLSSRREVTYSAPLAKKQFTQKTQLAPDGTVQRLQPPLRYPGTHLCGTDKVGEDVLYLAIKSIRTGLVIGILTTLVAIPFALFFGLLSGYYGSWVDTIVQFLCTLINAIPSILLIAAVILIFGRGLPQICIAMGISSWTVLCRLIRGETLKLRETDFTQASLSLGTPAWRILLRHILPNVMHIVLIHSVLRFSGLVLTEATLTFLGLGVGTDTISWGAMINGAQAELTRDPVIWWKLTTAFVFMLGLVLPANIFGDAVRDALDPKLRTH